MALLPLSLEDHLTEEEDGENVVTAVEALVLGSLICR